MVNAKVWVLSGVAAFFAIPSWGLFLSEENVKSPADGEISFLEGKRYNAFVAAYEKGKKPFKKLLELNEEINSNFKNGEYIWMIQLVNGLTSVDDQEKSLVNILVEKNDWGFVEILSKHIKKARKVNAIAGYMFCREDKNYKKLKSHIMSVAYNCNNKAAEFLKKYVSDE